MRFTLPTGTDWIVQVVFWCLLILVGVLFMGILFWIKKYIRDNDDHHKSVEKRLKGQSDEFSGFTDKLDEGVKKIDAATVEMAKTQANFQKDVSKELVKIHEVTGNIKNDLTEGRVQVQLIAKDLEQLSTTVTAHHESLSLGAKTLQKQREGLANLKTVVIQLNDDLKLIKGVKVKREGK